MSSKHTPTPPFSKIKNSYGNYTIMGAGMKSVLVHAASEEAADIIVRACNSCDEHREIIKGLMSKASLDPEHLHKFSPEYQRAKLALEGDFTPTPAVSNERYIEALQQIEYHAFDDDTPEEDIRADFERMREIARNALAGAPAVSINEELDQATRNGIIAGLQIAYEMAMDDNNAYRSPKLAKQFGELASQMSKDAALAKAKGE